ncbi:hypothetical protein ACT7TL_003277 [Vibrio cholerae]
METFRKVKEKYAVAFLLNSMDKRTRLSFILGVIGMFFQFTNTLLDGANYFIGSQSIILIMNIISILAGITICLVCLVVFEAVFLRQRLKRKNTKM